LRIQGTSCGVETLPDPVLGVCFQRQAEFLAIGE
jgi:hypothetical protein